LQFNDTVITETISVALLLYPALGLALSECKQWQVTAAGTLLLHTFDLTSLTCTGEMINQ